MTKNDLINDAFDNGLNDNNKGDVDAAVKEIISSIDKGIMRVAENHNGEWSVNETAKKAILLSFRLRQNKLIDTSYTKFFDKVDSKFSHTSEEYLRENNIRIVPQAIARYGSFIDKNVVLMPSFINIGAYVGEGTMVDTWATVGSCAQIGSNVHLSGGVGIGGVLEPLQASPTIIEDNCFIGARSEVVEGVIVRKIQLYRWAYLLEKVQRYMIEKHKPFRMVKSLKALLLSPDLCHLKMVHVIFIVL